MWSYCQKNNTQWSFFSTLPSSTYWKALLCSLPSHYQNLPWILNSSSITIFCSALAHVHHCKQNRFFISVMSIVPLVFLIQLHSVLLVSLIAVSLAAGRNSDFLKYLKSNMLPWEHSIVIHMYTWITVGGSLKIIESFSLPFTVLTANVWRHKLSRDPTFPIAFTWNLTFQTSGSRSWRKNLRSFYLFSSGLVSRLVSQIVQ